MSLASILTKLAPVIGDVAMETITETIITESTMIGHNPQTPGGVGVGVGTTIALGRLATLPAAQYAEGWIVLIDDAVDFLDWLVWWLNEALDRGINVVAAILKKDDGVLVNNRLRKTLPVVDEVTLLEQVPEGGDGGGGSGRAGPGGADPAAIPTRSPPSSG